MHGKCYGNHQQGLNQSILLTKVRAGALAESSFSDPLLLRDVVLVYGFLHNLKARLCLGRCAAIRSMYFFSKKSAWQRIIAQA